MLGCPLQFLPQIPTDVVIVHRVAELAPHDDGDNVLVDVATDQQGTAYRPQALESGSGLLQLELLEQAPEVLADGVVPANRQQAQFVRGSRGDIVRIAIVGTEHQATGAIGPDFGAMLETVANGIDHGASFS